MGACCCARPPPWLGGCAACCQRSVEQPGREAGRAAVGTLGQPGGAHGTAGPGCQSGGGGQAQGSGLYLLPSRRLSAGHGRWACGWACLPCPLWALQKRYLLPCPLRVMQHWFLPPVASACEQAHTLPAHQWGRVSAALVAPLPPPHSLLAQTLCSLTLLLALLLLRLLPFCFPRPHVSPRAASTPALLLLEQLDQLSVRPTHCSCKRSLRVDQSCKVGTVCSFHTHPFRHTHTHHTHT